MCRLWFLQCFTDQRLCLAKKSTNCIDVLLTLADAVWLCSPWKTRLHTEEDKKGNVRSRASLQYKMLHQQLELHMVCSPFQLCFIKRSCCWNVSKQKRIWGFIEATISFLTPSKTNPFWPPAYQSDQGNVKSKQHKRYQKTWGRAVIQRDRLLSGLNPPPHYWLQIVSDIKVASQTGWLGTLPQCNFTTEETGDGTAHTTSRPYREAKDEDERGRQSRGERQARDKHADADAKRRQKKKQITAEVVLRELEKDKRDESKCALALRHQSTPPWGSFSKKTLNRCNGPIKDLNSPCSPDNTEVRPVKKIHKLSPYQLWCWAGSRTWRHHWKCDTHVYTCKLQLEESKLEVEEHVWRHAASPAETHRLLSYNLCFFF